MLSGNTPSNNYSNNTNNNFNFKRIIMLVSLHPCAHSLSLIAQLHSNNISY